MDTRIKYIVAATAAAAFMMAAYLYPAETFITFTVGWLFFIPAAFVVYMTYSFLEYMKERRHRIIVGIKPTEAMKALARREAELKREKDLIYRELKEGVLPK
jgi:hypothetical protein